MKFQKQIDGLKNAREIEQICNQELAVMYQAGKFEKKAVYTAMKMAKGTFDRKLQDQRFTCVELLKIYQVLAYL